MSYVTTKIKSDTQPSSFENLGNEYWYYNYDIVTSTEPGEDGDKTVYSFVNVRIKGTPNFQKCYEAILKTFKSTDSDATLYDYSLTTDSLTDQMEDIVYNIKVDLGLITAETELERAKTLKLRDISNYDSSDAVNCFYLNGTAMWLSKADRVGLMNSITIQKAAGASTTTMWFGGTAYTLDCDAAISMLSALELYALDCYNVTAQHEVAVAALESVEEVEAYDYTTGYPDKLNLTF